MPHKVATECKHDHSIGDTFKRVIAYNQISFQGDMNPLRAAATVITSSLRTLLSLLNILRFS